VTLPSKEELLERERRWLRPAGILAIAGALTYAAGTVLSQTVLSGTNTDAEQLAEFHQQASKIIIGQSLQGVGFALFVAPLFVLISAAAGRTEKVRRGLVPFAFIGPVLIAVSLIVIGFGFADAGDTFVDKAPAAEQQARQQAEAVQAQGQGKGAGTAEEEPKTPDEAADDAREDLADDVIDDTGTLRAGRGLGLPAILSLVFGMVYIPLWSMRTGLLTRFWATLGMALGVSLILLGPLGQIGLVMWFAVIGLMLAGWWARPRPPAWEAGVATPWPRPGEDLGEPGGPVEGSGREVSEPPLSDAGELPSGEPREPGKDDPGSPETQGQRRRKRKRRS
jgi:MFS family permease